MGKHCWRLIVSYRSNGLRMFFKIGVLKNFANSTGKHLYWSLFLTSCRPSGIFDRTLPVAASVPNLLYFDGCKHIRQKIYLKVHSCKFYNNKYMIASTRIRNTEIFAFAAVLALNLLSRKVLSTNRKDNRNC